MWDNLGITRLGNEIGKHNKYVPNQDISISKFTGYRLGDQCFNFEGQIFYLPSCPNMPWNPISVPLKSYQELFL
jgi:hypothetical protein